MIERKGGCVILKWCYCYPLFKWVYDEMGKAWTLPEKDFKSYISNIPSLLWYSLKCFLYCMKKCKKKQLGQSFIMWMRKQY